MAQTFYIESDEEIISVISHLRKSLEEENIFVFPKRALVLQSIINLRLLEREAEKFRKRIVIVTQDEVGKMLAEKAGIAVQDYQEDFSKKESHLEVSLEEHPQAEAITIEQRVSPSHIKESLSLLSADTIGSSAFNMEKSQKSVKESVSVAPFSSFASESTHSPEGKISIRNASPEKLTYLNSKRTDLDVPERPVRPLLIRPTETAPLGNVQKPLSPIARKMNEGLPRVSEQGHNERLKNFYAGANKEVSPSAVRAVEQTTSTGATVSKNAHVFFFALGGISLLSLFVVGLFFFLPKAEVHVTPYKMSQSFEKEFNGKIANDSNNDIPIRIVEKEQEVSVTVSTTGKSGGTDQKSHGTVTLYNNFSTEPQPLVATTRLEDPKGKIFRLESGVTIPGMTTVDGKKMPGKIEAEVTADQAGEEYNIEATNDFSIPGFKGSPKYEKFSASSSKGMVGGGKSGISDVFVVTKLDQDTVLREATAKAKEAFLDEVRGQIDASEKILEGQIEVITTTPPALPSVGTVANTIEYRGIFKVKSVVFLEKSVKEKIESMDEKNIQGISLRLVSSNITYDDSLVDFTLGTVRIRANALLTMESVINIEKLRQMLSGKDMKSIEQSLSDFPELKSIRIIFYPEWFVQRVPKSENRISIIVDPGESQ